MVRVCKGAECYHCGRVLGQDISGFGAVPGAQPPALIRKEAYSNGMFISIRNGSAATSTDWFWTQIWLSMVRTLEHLLPDMDIAVNPMDEPRLVVPWEEVDSYMRAAGRTQKMEDPGSMISEFRSLPPPGEGADNDVETPEKNWERTSESPLSSLSAPYWLRPGLSLF